MNITVNGRSFDVTLPPLDLREELFYGYGTLYKRAGVPLLRLYSAMIALSVPEVAFGLRISTSGARADLAEYGGTVYIALKGKGWKVADITAAGLQLVDLLHTDLYPRESEVEEARGNSEGAKS